MTRVLFVSEEDYGALVGESSPGHSLAPRPLAAGGYALPISSAYDPMHRSKWDHLKSLEIRNIAPDDFQT